MGDAVDQNVSNAITQAAAAGPKELADLLYDIVDAAHTAREGAALHAPSPEKRGLELSRLGKMREASLAHKMAYEPRG